MKYSKLGYKRYSPDLYKKYNVIPSGRITMKDVDFPVFGMDNLGNQQMMYPGQEYQFPGNQVFELPMAQRGGNVVDDEIFFPMMKSIASGMDIAGDWLNNTLEDASVAFKRNMYSSPYAPMMAAIDAGAKPWLFENVRPVAYPGIFTGITELASGALGRNAPPQRDAQGDYTIGEEAWRRSLGLQTSPKYIIPSKYKPTRATDPNAQYYTLNQDVIDPALLIAEAKKRNLQTGQSVVLPSLAPYIREGFMPRDEFSQVDPLQNFTIGAGQDARGKYISIYDIYDLEGPAAAVTTPYEFYDRFYYQSGGQRSAEELVNNINIGRGAFRAKAPNYTPTYNDLVSMYKSIPSYNSGYESLQDVDDRRAGVQRIGPLTKERTEQLASMPSEQQLLNTYLGQTFGRLPVIEGSKIYEGYSPNRIWTGKDPWIPYKYKGDPDTSRMFEDLNSDHIPEDNVTDRPSYLYMIAPKQEGNSWNWDKPTDSRGMNDFFFDPFKFYWNEPPLWHMPKDLLVAEALFNKVGKQGVSEMLNREVSDFGDLGQHDWEIFAGETGLTSDDWFRQLTPIYWNDWQPTRKEMLKDPRILKYSEDNNLGLAGDAFISEDYPTFKPSTGYQEGAPISYSNLLIESILAKKDAELNNRAIGHATGEGYGVIQDPNQFNLVGYLPINDTLRNSYLQPMFNNAKSEDASGAAYRNMVMDMAGVPIDEELRDRVLFHTNAFPIQEYKPAQQKVGGEMIKRADGSYSRRGLWDNIRANKGSGKKPTKEMLEQERKIRKAQSGAQLKPIYLSDPNDPSIRSYQDSLNLYNNYRHDINRVVPHASAVWAYPYYRNEKKRILSPTGSYASEYKKYNSQPIKPIGFHLGYNAENSATGTGSKAGLILDGDIRYSFIAGDTSDIYVTPIYKKPVQPYKYADPEIVAKQKQLKDAGLYDGELDGIWGEKSKAAWETFNAPRPQQIPQTQIIQGSVPTIQQFRYMSPEDKARAITKYGSPGAIPATGADITALAREFPNIEYGPNRDILRAYQTGGQPVSSGMSTSFIRNAVPLPQNASQLIAATITGDTRYGWDDMDPRSRYELMRSVANARTRTGSNKGGTEYIDYSPQVDRDINNLSTSGPNMLIGSMFSPEFSTATTIGRVSYQYDPATRTYSIYDSYDFSPTSGSGTTYATVRNAAGRVAPSNGQPNLIARYTDDDYNEYTRKYKNDAFRVPYKSVTEFTDEAAKFLTHPIDYISDAFSFKTGGRVPRYNRKMYR